MTQEEIDILWQKAMQESIKDGEMFTRYHFAQLVTQKAFNDGYEKGVAGFMQAVDLEREACAKLCDEYADDPVYCGDAIRARGQA